MTTKQKQELASLLLQKAGDIVEYWDEIKRDNDIFSNVDSRDIADTLGKWLAKLPGNAWDVRLTDPK